MSSEKDQPARMLVLVAPACEPERVAPEQRLRVSRLWDEAFEAVQRTIPGAVQLRQGCCAMRARGPTRYYGGEAEAAQVLLGCVAELLQGEFDEGLAVGVASGRFTAEQAALMDIRDHPHAQDHRHARSHGATQAHTGAPDVLCPSPGIRLVAAERTSAFLSGLPIERAADEHLAPVLAGLGIRTLGTFASLPEDSVLQRFGTDAQLAHRRARGLGEPHGAEITSGAPRHDLSVSFEFEPPLEGVDQLAFACSGYAENFVRGLGEHALVCTELRVELIDDTATSHERRWSHPANFTASDVVNRVRWQAATLPQAPDRGGAGVAAVRITPERTSPAAAHEPGLWNDAPSERVHHQLTRVQSLLGPEGVATGMITGGRVSTDRQRLVPWGSKRTHHSGHGSAARSNAGPWPGRLQGPLPNIVSTDAIAATLLDAQGATVTIDADELLSSTPSSFCVAGEAPRRVHNWSAPWPLREHWWSPSVSGEASYRMQLVLEDGQAWLLRYTAHSDWSIEGRYA